MASAKLLHEKAWYETETSEKPKNVPLGMGLPDGEEAGGGREVGRV